MSCVCLGQQSTRHKYSGTRKCFMNLLRLISHPRAHQPSVGPTGFFSPWLHKPPSMGTRQIFSCFIYSRLCVWPPPLRTDFQPDLAQVRPITTVNKWAGLIRWLHFHKQPKSLPRICLTFIFSDWLFWSAPVDNALWKSKMNSDVLDVFAYWSRDVRLQTIRLVAATQRVWLFLPKAEPKTRGEDCKECIYL